MGTLRLDHVCVVVDDIDAATEVFLYLGFDRVGEALAEGEVVDRINGLEGVRAQIVMVQAPDRSGKLELVKYLSPADTEGGARPLPANRLGFRHIAIEVDDLDSIVDGLREKGFDTVGEICEYGNVYRLCYVHGPEGLILELAERIPSEGES
jgi:catechol 2,3-dioxygenase-like lactoylglutathione lyase family enzyme